MLQSAKAIGANLGAEAHGLLDLKVRALPILRNATTCTLEACAPRSLSEETV